MTDYIVTGPDGKKLKISADNEEALNHAVGQLFDKPAAPGLVDQAKGAVSGIVNGASPPAPKPTEEPSLVDRVMSGAKSAVDTAGGLGAQGLIGIRKGVSGLFGIPVDLATAAINLGGAGINKVTGSNLQPIHDPIGGGGSLDRIFAAPARAAQAVVGKDQQDPAPRNFGERLANRIGQEVGAAAVPVVGALGKAARVGVEGARELSPLQRMFVEPAAVNPGRFVQRETAAAVAAGGGAGAVNEMSGKADAEAKGQHPTGWQQAGDVAGAVGGVGLNAVGSKILNAAGHVVGALTGRSAAADQVIRDVATDEIARAAGLAPNKEGKIDTAPLASRIENGQPVAETIPGFQESTADRSKSAGLAAMEYGRQSGPNSGLYAARRGANTEAVDAAMRRSEPQATPGAFGSELAGVRDRQLRDAVMGREAAEDTAATATAPLTPQGTPAARGNTIRTELETARDTARAETAQAYEAAGIHDNPLQPTTLAEALDSVTARLPQADRSATPQGLIDRIAQLPAGQPTTMREATALKTHLLGLQEKAAAEPGGRNAARVLGQYIDAVEGVIQGGITAEQRTALGEARGARRAEGDAFERKGDPVAGVLSRNPGGVPKMRDENVAALSTRDDAMARLFEEADTPATREAIRNQLLSNADISTAAGLHAFEQQYGPQIARFPGLSDQLGEAIRARVSENTARGAEGGLLKEIGPQGKGAVAKYLQYGDENATKAMTGVLKSKDPAKSIDELLTFVGDEPKAVEGARRTFWEILQKQTRSDGSTTKTISGVQPYLPAALKRFTEDPATAAVAERLYRDNPEHWQNIKSITEAMQGVDVRNAAKAPNTSGTPQGLQPGFLPSGETLASRVFAVERGVVSPAFAALNVAGIIARKAIKRQSIDAVNKAIDTALLDPDFAAAMLRQNNPANRAALRRATRGWQGHEASTLLDMLEPEDKDAETKKAVMRDIRVDRSR